jgi:hypothetical protein
LIEHQPSKLRVAGLSPVSRSKKNLVVNSIRFFRFYKIVERRRKKWFAIE